MVFSRKGAIARASFGPCAIRRPACTPEYHCEDAQEAESGRRTSNAKVTPNAMVPKAAPSDDQLFCWVPVSKCPMITMGLRSVTREPISPARAPVSVSDRSRLEFVVLPPANSGARCDCVR